MELTACKIGENHKLELKKGNVFIGTDEKAGTLAVYTNTNGNSKPGQLEIASDAILTLTDKASFTLSGKLTGEGTIVVNTKAQLDTVLNSSFDGTIQLGSDIEDNIRIAGGKDLNLDLNGKTLTNTGDVDTITVAKGGSLTVTGTGSVENNGKLTAALLNNGTATLKGGTFERTNNGKTGDIQWYAVQNHGTMTIAGATVKQCDDVTASALINGWSGYLEKDTHAPGDEATMTITSGYIIGGNHAAKQCAAAKGGSTFTISGGTFTPINGQDALTADAAVTVEGGTFNGKMYARNGGSIAISDTATVNGALTKDKGGTITVTGGTFSTDPKDYLEDGYKETNEDGTFTVKPTT